VIPVAMSLLEASAANATSAIHAASAPQIKPITPQILTLTEPTQTFTFDNIASKPIPSLLREFSAPVKVVFNYADDELAALVAHDTDGVTRWQALRTLFFRAIDGTTASNAGESNALLALTKAIATLLRDQVTDPALIAHMLTLPAHNELADRVATIDAAALADARSRLVRAIARGNTEAMVARYRAERAAIDQRPYAADAASVAHRALAGALLALANVESSGAAQHMALDQWQRADNLTDVMSAMMALRDQPCAARDAMYGAFHDHWQSELSMLNRWFSLEACAHRENAATFAQSLLAHPKFDNKNPNRVRAVVHSFGDQNWRGFHAEDGSGYDFVAAQILAFDAQNPSLAARFCDAFSRWHKFAEHARAQQKAALERIAASDKLSSNVRELVEKTLKAGA
jgi:aminopeptidase N